MAWSWSHTADAYQAAEDRLRQLPRKTLQIIWAEWKAHQPQPSPPPENPEDDADPDTTGWHQEVYDDAIVEARKIPTEALADSIWQQMREQATCDNGGFQAWCCPFGCGCHLVSFDPIRDRTQGIKA